MTPILVIGTDTGVGKSVVSIALTKAMSQITPTRYWKPVQSGKGNWDSDKAIEILGADRVIPPTYSLTAALSPHLAAKYDGIHIDRAKIESDLDRHLSSPESIVIEAVGGALVPLTHELLFADLVSDWPVGVIIVVHDRLGAINHTLLTVEACLRRDLNIFGMIYNQHETEFGNEESIAEITKIPTLALFPKYATEEDAIDKIAASEEIRSLSLAFSSSEVS